MDASILQLFLALQFSSSEKSLVGKQNKSSIYLKDFTDSDFFTQMQSIAVL